MARLLEKLGVPRDVRLFFQPYHSVMPDGSLRFPFGDRHEHFGSGFQLVPNAAMVWSAGNGPLLFIAFSAMECIAFLAANRQRFNDLAQLRFVAVGQSLQNLPPVQAQKITLLFGNDLPGRLADVYVSSLLVQKPVRVSYAGNEQFELTYHSRRAVLTAARISLNTAEKALGIRSGIRTIKPATYSTFLEQLLNQIA